MIRIAICCGGGMSSSVLSVKMNQQIKELHWEDKVSIKYMPIVFLLDHLNEFDIAMLCPHLLYTAKEIVEKCDIHIPLYIIPARIYGLMDAEALFEDAFDILKLFPTNNENPIHFPNEKFLETKRNTSYRRWLKRNEF